MSPTVAELLVGLIAAILVFLFAIRVVPIVMQLLANYFNRSLNDEQSERNQDDYDRDR